MNYSVGGTQSSSSLHMTSAMLHILYILKYIYLVWQPGKYENAMLGWEK
jgi:thiosulfate reductase cytochrome b subunit